MVFAFLEENTLQSIAYGSFSFSEEDSVRIIAGEKRRVAEIRARGDNLDVVQNAFGFLSGRISLSASSIDCSDSPMSSANSFLVKRLSFLTCAITQ